VVSSWEWCVRLCNVWRRCAERKRGVIFSERPERLTVGGSRDYYIGRDMGYQEKEIFAVRVLRQVRDEESRG
jgi:hypothetical protein